MTEIEMNSIGLAIMCNFPHFCGEERAKAASDMFRAMKDELLAYRACGTVEDFDALKDEKQKRQAGCVRCESPCQTCMIGCFKQEPDTCGGYTLPPMQYFCKTCGRDLRGESHE